MKENSYKQKNSYRILGKMTFIGMVLFILYLIITARNSLVSCFTGTTVNYYILVTILITFTFFAVKDEKIFFLYITGMFIFFIWLSFVDTGYSPLDEAMHFDYINHIIATNKLPTFGNWDYTFLNAANNSINSCGKISNFESVQAPLYYILMAVVGKFIKNAYLRLHIFRIISLTSVWITYFFIKKTCNILKKQIAIRDDVLRIALLLTIFNPAYLYRLSRLNNETLVCVLIPILLYIAIKCLSNGYEQKYYWTMAFLCIAIFLTKSTAVYVYIIPCLVAIFQKKVKNVIVPIIISAVPSIPWFGFNYYIYGSFTGMEEHIKRVIPIANPTQTPRDLIDAFFNVFLGTYFTGEEIGLSGIDAFWVNSLFVVCLFWIFFLIKNAFVDFKHNKLEVEKYCFKIRINIICLLIMCGCVFCLIMGTISTKIDALRGRYFYGPCVALAFLIIINVTQPLTKDVQRAIYSIAIISIGIVFTRNIVMYTDRIYTDNHLYSNNVKKIELYNLSDTNWRHGYSISNNCLLIRLEKSDSVENYNALIGHIVSNDIDSAIIIGVTDTGIVNDERYIYLLTNKHMDGDSNTLNIGKYCKKYNYNTGATDTITDNIEEYEVAQTLKIKKTGRVWGCEINLATYAHENYDATVRYKIKDEDGYLMQDGYTEIENIVDNEYSTIYFDEPIEVYKNQVIMLSFIYDNDKNYPLSLKVSDNDSYKEGAMYLEGKEMEGKDMGIKILMENE